MLRKGSVCLPSEQGPVVARSADGAALDPFEVIDRLTSAYDTVYVVDLDGIERGEPQLDYIQELSREATIWVDAGIRNSDQAIDILVAGASRAVLSSATLDGPREVRRSWRLSTDISFEIELTAKGTRLRGDWPVSSAADVALHVREMGPTEIVLSPREIPVDWTLVGALAAGGPAWVDGSFDESQAALLGPNRAAGGIFHIDRLLYPTVPLTSSTPSPSGRAAR